MAAGRPSLRYQAIISLLALFMVNAVIASLSGFWHLNVDSSHLLLFAGVSVAFAWLSWRFPWPTAGLVVLASAVLVAAIWLGYLPRVDVYLQTIATQAAAFTESWRESQLEAAFGPNLGLLFLVSTAVAAALVILPESLAKGNTFWAVALGTVVFGTEWAWYYDSATTHFIAFAVLAFCAWILGQAARRDALWASSGRKIGYPSHVVTPVAWVLVVAMVAIILPSDFNPLDLGAWGDKAQEAFPVLKQLRGAGVGTGTGRFSLRTTGFSPTLGALGGPVSLDRNPALQLTMDKPLTETAYLRGATYQVYDSKSWERGKPADVEVPKDGVLPSYFSAGVQKTYLTAKVTHETSIGFTVFAIWEPMQVEGLKNGYKADADGNLWSTRDLPKGTSYTIYARFPTYSAEQLRAITSTEAGDSYKPYLQVPGTLPSRVSDLTKRITADQATPYDKAVAIESYLRGLPYDLNVQPAPPGQDFVDYFLFDARRGYCVYSASAMTVMLRTVGIPSRMVEGFAVPAASQYTEGANGQRTYTVLNSQAHAWVEAYFPTYGWVTFDPTPRADLPIIDRSAPSPKAPDGSTGNTSDSNTPTGDNQDPRTKPIPNEGRNVPEDVTVGGPSPVERSWPWAVTVVAAFGGAFLLAYRRLRSQERIVAREDGQVVQEVWSKSGSLMKQFSLGPKPHQTALEYATDIDKRWPDLGAQAHEVAQEYTEARYAPPGHPLPAEAPKHARAFWNQLHALLFSRYGWRTYLWRRLRWRFKSPE